MREGLEVSGGLIDAETGFDAEKYVDMVILAGANICWALTTFLRKHGAYQKKRRDKCL